MCKQGDVAAAFEEGRRRFETLGANEDSCFLILKSLVLGVEVLVSIKNFQWKVLVLIEGV